MIIDALLDTVMDSIKLLPFLFLTYLLMEYIEHKMGKKTQNVLKASDKFGPLWGAVLGMIPQCGFSAAASNLFAGRIITMGTLIAIYLSTSDEMLPILISESVHYTMILKILFMKVVIGLIAGFILDFILSCKNKGKVVKIDVHHFCEHEHCHCEKGILKPALMHTLKIFVFIFILSAVLNLVIAFMGTQVLADFILNRPILGELLAGLIGLIPNCAASVIITQLYLEGALPFGTMMAGLLVGAGVGLMILFRVNDNKKENFKIAGILYAVGVVAGMLINLATIK